MESKDSCTFFFEGKWAHCCKTHDSAYSLQTGKIEADVALFQCVKDSGGLGYGLIAALMLVGVSIFGFTRYKKK